VILGDWSARRCQPTECCTCAVAVGVQRGSIRLQCTQGWNCQCERADCSMWWQCGGDRVTRHNPYPCGRVAARWELALVGRVWDTLLLELLLHSCPRRDRQSVAFPRRNKIARPPSLGVTALSRDPVRDKLVSGGRGGLDKQRSCRAFFIELASPNTGMGS
jgi:hypothetical protein